MDLKTMLIEIPTWAIMYIEYNDPSGLSGEDIAEVDNWLENLYDYGYRNPCFSYDGDPYFSNSPEFGLSGEVILATMSYNFHE